LRPVWIEVFSSVSAVQAMLITWPGGVTAAEVEMAAGDDRAVLVSRSVMVTGAAPSISMISRRVSNGAQPSGVRYCSGLSGFSSST
jgi:hypothetical protein